MESSGESRAESFRKEQSTMVGNRRRSLGAMPVGAAAFSRALHESRQKVQQSLNDATSMMLQSVAEGLARPEDSSLDGAGAVRRIFDAATRQVVNVLEELSEADAAAHRLELKAIQSQYAQKVERTRRASAVGLQNAAAAAEASQAAALAKQAHTMSSSSNAHEDAADSLQELNQQMTEVKRKLETQTALTQRAEAALRVAKNAAGAAGAADAMHAELKAELKVLQGDKGRLTEQLAATEQQRDDARADADAKSRAANEESASRMLLEREMIEIKLTLETQTALTQRTEAALRVAKNTSGAADAIQATVVAELEAALKLLQDDKRRLIEQLAVTEQQRDDARADADAKSRAAAE
jgi:hypothetical protein